jgi:anaerobic selenocysteine-containing dehydrogenase
MYGHPERLTRPLMRTADGRHVPIPLDEAIGLIAQRLKAVFDTDGPRSVATYHGTNFAFDSQPNLAMLSAFQEALGIRMDFGSGTNDAPGKALARGLHGMWMAPVRTRDAQAVLLIGQNPMVTHAHRNGVPRDLMADLTRPGTKLIVVDPRKTETAKRAAIHLQARPGHDASILASLLRQILEDGLEDRAFIDANVDGLEQLRAAVAPFVPAEVARRAGIDAADLVEAARAFAVTRFGYGVCGVGPNMSGEGTLIEYLLLCIDTVCGHWMREGEQVHNAYSILPSVLQMAKAQAKAPFPSFGYGEKLRVRELTQTAAGTPCTAMADEILMPGEGQIRALISVGGNPASAIPDEAKVRRALRSLDLFVHMDAQMSPASQLADFVLPLKLSYEQAGTSMMQEFMTSYANGSGLKDSFAQYTPAIVDPPQDAEVSTAWESLFLIAQRLGLQLRVGPGVGFYAPAGEPIAIDMSRIPTTDELLDIVHSGSRISLDEVKRHPHGAFFPSPSLQVAPKDPDWEGRLQVGDSRMMADLASIAGRADDDFEEFPFRLTCRRIMWVHNTPSIAMPANRPSYNPAYLHPDDLLRLGCSAGDEVTIRSSHSSIRGIVEADATLRPGVVSMPHNYADSELEGNDLRDIGSNTNRLIPIDEMYDRYSGQARMTSVPVSVTPVGSSSADAPRVPLRRVGPRSDL